MGLAPLAIVWPCRLSVAEYAAAGKVHRRDATGLPDCGRALIGWSVYWRWLREGAERRIWIRRARCRSCRRTHALLPDFVHARRLEVAS